MEQPASRDDHLRHAEAAERVAERIRADGLPDERAAVADTFARLHREAAEGRWSQ